MPTASTEHRTHVFIGAIPQPIQQILNQHAARWTCDSVYVGCSGNFTIERVLATHRRFTIRSNDVSLYSSILGALFARQPFRIALAATSPLAWLAPYLESPVGAAATVLLATRLVDAVDATGQPTNRHYARFVTGFQRQWPTLHARTVDKLKALDLRLDSFTPGDVVDWAATIPDEAGFVVYPPTGDTRMNRLNRRLEALFDWDRPTFQPLGSDRLDQFVDQVAKRRFWFMAVLKDKPELRPYLRGIVQTSQFSAPVYLYAANGDARLVMPVQKTQPVRCPRLMPGDLVGDTLGLAPLNGSQFNALRSQYLNAGIKPVPAAAAFGVLADGKLIGAFAYSSSPNYAQYDDLSCIYLLSDFAVAPTDYDRLAKLVLYAVLSRESKLLAERLMNRRIRRCITTAFSNNPVSMKYRGLFDLETRKVTDPAKHPDHKFQLQYAADLGGWSLAEGLAIWKQKHGARAA